MRHSSPIKFGYCVAYDWEMLPLSISRVYEYATKIVLSLDKNHTSWNGKVFSLDENKLKTTISKLDTQNKITLLAENFFQPQLSPMENEVYQRNRMAEALGLGGWHIQLDVDEYFVDFPSFLAELENLSKSKKPEKVYVKWLAMMKKVTTGYLLANTLGLDKETIPIAFLAERELPNYSYGRYLKNEVRKVKTSHHLLHQTWAREEDEIIQKINNWGHVNDFKNKDSFLKLWLALDQDNYQYIKNFHFLVPEAVPSLSFHSANDITELLKKVPKEDMQLKGKYKLYNQRQFIKSFLT